MTLFLAYRSLGITKTITIQDGDGETIIPGANDQLRAKIGREGADALLTVTETASVAGSVFTKDTTAGANTLRLDATDLATLEAGTYTLTIILVDNADATESKNVDRQVFQLCP